MAAIANHCDIPCGQMTVTANEAKQVIASAKAGKQKAAIANPVKSLRTE
jgi:hypothetical protein